VLRSLGKRESGTARLKEAALAYRLALEVRTRDREPLDWAMTQNNLGVTLRNLGERESGTVHLEQAIVAYRLTLEEWTRERVPLDWAGTQNNLGAALRSLGKRKNELLLVEAAITAHEGALEVFQAADATASVEAVEANLDHARVLLSELSPQ
jgi:tetratricopeptide (TPR) repeat protein